MNCPRCNAQLPMGAAFCSVCGTPVQQAPQPTVQQQPGGIPPQTAVPPQGIYQQPAYISPQGFQQQPVLFRLRGLFLHRKSKHMEMFAHKVLSPHSKGIRNSSDMSRRKNSHNSRHRDFNKNMSHRKASHNSNHRDSNNSPHSSRHEDHSNNHVLFRQPRQPPRDLRYS